MGRPRAMMFDIFGTVVDWRTSVAQQLAAFGAERGMDRDWVAMTDRWRELYQPSMEQVRSGGRPFTILDVLHRESLETVLAEFDVDGLPEGEKDRWNMAWHRLDAWPDVGAALPRLRKHCKLSPCSNGNVSLMVDVARHAGLQWDAVLGAEPCQGYKPQPVVYLRTAEMLGVAPSDCMMVAAHNDDLAHARALGFQCGFVARPTEYGPNQTKDLIPDQDWEFSGDGFDGLADWLDAHAN